MKLARLAVVSLLAFSQCGDDDGGGGGGSRGAVIQTKLTAAGGSAANDKFRSGAATLESLRYYISTIMICESLEVQGSGFNNPGGCVELYKRDLGALSYELNGDWTGLANIARQSDEGFIDLMSATSRAGLASNTQLTAEHAHAYHYGIINWALPIKLRGRVPFTDGTSLYTHDGVTSFETYQDGFRAYYTAPSTPLDRAPAEDAVVLLGNGGNWFKFQTPLTITMEDIEQRREYVLDLVFNPDGIVNGYAEGGTAGNLSQRSSSGMHVFDITVPMLDLAPVPHRAEQRVVRESYRGTTQVEGNSFDVRIELYAIDGEDAVYGADIKTLNNGAGTQAPPSIVKASFVERTGDGTLSISSWRQTPVITGLRRQTTLGQSTRVSLKCGTHSERAAAEGGAAIVVERCPGATLDVDLTLLSRNFVEGSIPAAVGAGPADAGVDGGIVDAASLMDAR